MPFEKKNQNERLGEVIKVLKQFQSLGFPQDEPGIIEISNILKKYVYDGNYANGKIKLRGFEREIIYQLYTRKGTEIAVNLRYVRGL